MTKQNPIKAHPSKKTDDFAKKTKKQWDEYLNTISFQIEPASGGFKKRMGIELVEFCRMNPKAYRISQFFNGRGIHIATWYDWKAKDPELDVYHRTALSLLADRRETGGLEKVLDTTLVKHTMPMFDEEWKKHEEWRAKLNEGTDGIGHTKIVVMERFGDEK